MGERKGCCCTKKCCIITWAILIPLLIALALILFFLIPRIPEHNESFNGINSYQLNNTYFMMNVSYSIQINNKNWVPIKIGKSHIEVWYRNVTYIGETNPNNIVFPKRQNTTHTENAIVVTTDPTVIAALTTGGSVKSFTTRGYIRVVYLGIGIKINLNETFEADISSSKRTIAEQVAELVLRKTSFISRAHD